MEKAIAEVVDRSIPLPHLKSPQSRFLLTIKQKTTKEIDFLNMTVILLVKILGYVVDEVHYVVKDVHW